MSLEIEHKYLVIDDSFRELAVEKIEMHQGYLSRMLNSVIRVRITDKKAFLTIKGKNNGDTRTEFEYEIPFEDAQKMLDLCQGNIISKTRYIVPYEGFVWEVDVFHKNHEGLIIAEIELPTSDTPYTLPPFVGENVTGNPMYYNSNL